MEIMEIRVMLYRINVPKIQLIDWLTDVKHSSSRFVCHTNETGELRACYNK